MPCLRQSRRKRTSLALKAHCAFNPEQARRSELPSRALRFMRSSRSSRTKQQKTPRVSSRGLC
nr:hypothetical protein [Gardnerella vaginalis]